MSSDSDFVVMDLQSSGMRLEADRDKWRSLCLDLIEIVKNANLFKPANGSVVDRHRQEWPELWRQIDKISNTR